MPHGGKGDQQSDPTYAQVLDITARVPLEPDAVHGAIAEARQRADRQHRLAAIGQLAAGVAHDFDSIVSTIGVYAELLARDQRLDATGYQHVETIFRQTERATALIAQILDFAQGRPIERADVDLVALLQELVPVLRRTLPPGIRVTWRHDADRCLVRGDPARLQQILINLAANAKDAMSGQGELSFALSSQCRNDEGSPPSRGRFSAPWVRIDVADTGCGISPDVLARAFEPFFTTKPAGDGTGLGLAQVRHLVSQHDGHLEIESAPGRGTTVTIWLANSTVESLEVSPAQLHERQSRASS